MSPVRDAALLWQFWRLFKAERADLVLSYPRVESCPDGTPLIGPRALRHAQGLALWIGRDRIETLGVREARGARPWVR